MGQSTNNLESKVANENKDVSLLNKISTEILKAAAYIFVPPALVYLAKDFAGEDAAEAIKRPELWAYGIIVYTFPKILDAGFKFNRFIKEKIYSPEILDLESALKDAVKERKVEHFGIIAERLSVAYEKQGIDVKKAVSRHKDAYHTVLYESIGDMDRIARNGNLDRLVKEFEFYQNTLRNYINNFASNNGDLNLQAVPYDKIKRACANVHIKKELKNVEDELEGREGWLFLDYGSIKSRIDRLKALANKLNLKENPKLKRVEFKLDAYQLLDGKLAKLYDFAEESGDLDAVEKSFEEAKSSLTGYSDEVVNEAYRRIISIAQKKHSVF